MHTIAIRFALILSMLIAAAHPAGAQERGWLGVVVNTLTGPLKKQYGLTRSSGAVIVEVKTGGPAEASGLKVGDLIVRIGSVRVRGAESLITALEGHPPFDLVSVTFVRGASKEQTVSVLLGTLPSAFDKPVPLGVGPPSGEPSLDLGTDEPSAGSSAGGTFGMPEPDPGKATPDTNPFDMDHSLSSGGSLGGGGTAGGTPTDPGSDLNTSPLPGTDGGTPAPAEPGTGQAAPAPSAPATTPYWDDYYGYETPADPGQPKPDDGTDLSGSNRGIEPDDNTAGAPPPSPPIGQDAPPPTPPHDQPFTTVTVHYATDRAKTLSEEPAEKFSGDRGALVYGSCDVTIPKTHKAGELEAPSILRLEISEDPEKHVILTGLKEQPASDFYRDVSAKVAASEQKDAFVFVHGYNVSFADAARRTAQMAYDLKFKGAPVFFSWPSQGSYFSYTVDETNVEFAKIDLKAFLQDFVTASGAERIYLIAHSMGNRALTRAVADVLRESPEARAKIKEIILAAPDIDADIFVREIAPAITSQGQLVTLYASSNDWALKASKKFHGYARAGDTGDKLSIAPGITTIDSSEIETDFLGHSYFAESNSIIADMLGILAGRRMPGERSNLVPIDIAAGRYWKLTKPADPAAVPKPFSPR